MQSFCKCNVFTNTVSIQLNRVVDTACDKLNTLYDSHESPGISYPCLDLRLGTTLLYSYIVLVLGDHGLYVVVSLFKIYFYNHIYAQ